jgi:hypothetical protein
MNPQLEAFMLLLRLTDEDGDVAYVVPTKVVSIESRDAGGCYVNAFQGGHHIDRYVSSDQPAAKVAMAVAVLLDNPDIEDSSLRWKNDALGDLIFDPTTDTK